MQITFSDYRVLFDQQDKGFRASHANGAYDAGKLWLAFVFASDGARAEPQFSAESTDLGRTWSTPVPFGPPLSDPEAQFQRVNLCGVTRRGTTIAAGAFMAKGIREDASNYEADVLWRPADLIVGRRERGQREMTFDRYVTGTFMGEQFAEGVLETKSGRLVMTVWGAKNRNENWRCGVMLSDDDGKTWRFRDVGYEPSPAIRKSPRMPAGFNEQTLFEAADGTLVSIIRGREHLGATDAILDESYYFRSESHDGGETWSKPAITNLPGTGATAAGLVLPDGSLLMPNRVPQRAATTWVLPDPKIAPDPANPYGLHVARSFDLGRTWKTEKIFFTDPAGVPFNNYYNAMNGQFLPLAPGRWLYVFGHFAYVENRHRVLSVEVGI